MLNLANMITLGRLGAVPVIVWLILEQHHAAAFWLFVGAGVSDGVDGFLAKRCGMETALGRYLDPLADKALLVSLFVTLGWQHILPIWLVLLVISRDFLIIGAVLLAGVLDHDVEIRPTFVSKLNTVVQIALVSWVLAHFAFGFGDIADIGTSVMIGVTALTTAISWYRYLVIWLRDMSGMEQG
ncbi:CDP-alcohol phosphatidyltransferase family protein [Zavarzinia sp.]|uniref:CDP-alcohol phosphatidyltransferase family protein n=1 Tax=Zavarzinia sp. TaxID=2027920 RepID=UPI003BB58A02|nr:CDP-alcohol phosphatidyltransferase family protein [Zavarzinia sp.]